MRKSVDLLIDTTLKGIETRISDVGYQHGTIIKITQSNSTVYSIYNPDHQLETRKCLVSAKLCEYNQLYEGSASIVPLSGSISKCKNARVYVSALDWQIINNKSQRLQEQFLNQISLVWPGCQLPLFYDNKNCVKLRVQCSQLSLLVENTQLEILQQKSHDSQQAQDGQLEQKQSQLKFREIKVHTEYQFGNINRIEVPEQQFDKFGLSQDNYCIMSYTPVFNEFPTHTYDKSVHQQLEIIKQRQFPEKNPGIQKIAFLAYRSTTQNLSINKLTGTFLNINKTSNLEIEISRPKIQKKFKKLDYYLNLVSNFRIVIQIFDKKQEDDYYGQIKEEFCDRFIGYLRDNNGKISVFQKVPFMLGSYSVGYISFLENSEVVSDPFHVSYNQPQLQTQIKRKLYNCLKIHNLYYSSPQNYTAKISILLNLNRILMFPIPINHQFKELYRINYSQQIQSLLNFIDNDCLKFVLVSSYTNNGKTILHQILREEGYNPQYIDLGQINDLSLTAGDVTLFLETSFQRWNDPLIFLDNIDSVCQKIDSGDLHRKQQRIAAKMIVRKILNLAKVYQKKCIVTAKNDGRIDEQFRYFEHIKLKNPELCNREKVLKQYGKYTEKEVDEMAQDSQSMSFGEFYKYLTTKIKSEEKNDAMSPKKDFSRLAGLKEAKQMITSLIHKPLKYNFVFKNLPVKLSRGILLYGGSGTGKTALGQALADQFQMKLFSVKGSDILSKYIGGSEAAVREIFEKAMSVSPSIIFFDEFETIVPRRNSSNTGVTDRVVNQFLCYLDGVASIEGVFIVAASSRPDLIDPALLRPGRIDSHQYLEYPTIQEREQIFNLYKNSIKFEESEKIKILTQGYSYSDIVGLIKQLRIKKSSKVLEESDQPDEAQFKLISSQFLQQNLKNFKISVSKQEQARQQKEFLRFKTGRAPDISKQKTMLQ